MKWNRGEFTIADCPSDLDIDMIHSFLSDRSYWAKGISRETVVKAIANSLCFGLFQNSQQIGFGRIITDYATFAYLSDIFILEEYRGRGLGKWLVECMVQHPDLKGLRRWMLATADAHELYRRYGFKPLSQPEKLMER